MTLSAKCLYQKEHERPLILHSKMLTMKDLFERLLAGETIKAADPEAYKMMNASYATRKILQQMNNATDPNEVRRLFGEVLGYEVDTSVSVFTPLYFNYGKNIKISKNVFINFDCVFLDFGGITIGDNVLLAPKVCLLTESHPISAMDRHSITAKPIVIKNNAWIGANATILQGVTIGENSIVAAGAIVSEDVADNTIVGGVPARLIKTFK